ncbi:hypothetical protein BDV19DRAFT_362572 [Aspergillus venezuelensis]
MPKCGARMSNFFDKALTSALGKLDEDKSKDEKQQSASSPTRTSLSEKYRQLEEHIKRPFVCGETIDIAPGEKSNGSEKQNPPSVNVFWVTESGSTTTKLVLPSEDTAALKHLVKDCEPATFGKGQEDVHDPEYRNAGKMDANKFATTFSSCGLWYHRKHEPGPTSKCEHRNGEQPGLSKASC